jgi:hypothetical protein
VHLGSDEIPVVVCLCPVKQLYHPECLEHYMITGSTTQNIPMSIGNAADAGYVSTATGPTAANAQSNFSDNATMDNCWDRENISYNT